MNPKLQTLVIAMSLILGFIITQLAVAGDTTFRYSPSKQFTLFMLSALGIGLFFFIVQIAEEMWETMRSRKLLEAYRIEGRLLALQAEEIDLANDEAYHWLLNHPGATTGELLEGIELPNDIRFMSKDKRRAALILAGRTGSQNFGLTNDNRWFVTSQSKSVRTSNRKHSKKIRKGYRSILQNA